MNQKETDTLEMAAIMAHQANKALCELHGDFSQRDWDDSPDWQKESARAGVLAVTENKSITPEQTHESWLKAKEKDGWVYGDVKDAEKKTHPCMKPYSELPKDQRQKDYLFINVVLAMLK